MLSGGEIAALALIDACVRLLPGVMGKEASAAEESFADGLLEYPQYTRPPVFEGEPIPEVLISGDHAKVAAWRRAEAERLTRERRPDLWAAYQARKGPKKGPKPKGDKPRTLSTSSPTHSDQTRPRAGCWRCRRRFTMNIIQELEKEQVEKLSAGKDIPDFGPGDTVLVNVKVVEGDKAASRPTRASASAARAAA